MYSRTVVGADATGAFAVVVTDVVVVDYAVGIHIPKILLVLVLLLQRFNVVVCLYDRCSRSSSSTC